MDTKSSEVKYDLSYPEGETDGETPVVFLLGWGGSTSKLVAKYADIYLRKHCITISFAQPNNAQFFESPGSSKKGTRAQKLAQILVDRNLSHNPVLLHVFSNAGYLQYGPLAKTLMVQKRNIIGSVFDSSPGNFDLYLAASAFFESIRSFVPIPKWLLPSLIKLVVVVYNLILWFNLLLEKITIHEIEQLFVVSAYHTWPQLYLYSDSDTLVLTSNVTAVMEKAKNLALVRSHNFSTSIHVQHFRKFPDRYRKECVEFLQFCQTNCDKTNISNK